LPPPSEEAVIVVQRTLRGDDQCVQLDKPGEAVAVDCPLYFQSDCKDPGVLSCSSMIIDERSEIGQEVVRDGLMMIEG
jgi:hypothetical protein